MDVDTGCTGQVYLVNQLLEVCHTNGSGATTSTSPRLTCPAQAPHVLLDETSDGAGTELLQRMLANYWIGESATLGIQFGSAIAVAPAHACGSVVAALNDAVVRRSQIVASLPLSFKWR